MTHEHLGLFDTPPDRSETIFALAVVGVLFAAFLAIWPVSAVQLREVVAFIPAIDAIMFVGDLIIAAMLYTQAVVYRSRALTVLASGFVFMALLLIPHALTFPGAFAPDGLLGAGTNSTAWVMIIRRLGLPIAVILYVVLRNRDAAALAEAERPPEKALVWIFGAVALAAATTVVAIAGEDWLPPIFVNRSGTQISNSIISNSANSVLVAIAMGTLFRNRKSVLDLWLLVALAGWLLQSVLNLSVPARFTVGFYSVYLIMLIAHLVVLLALIVEANRLYARLALSTAARARERDARLMSMDAVAAAIVHEVGQPLAGVTLNAAAGLEWLTRKKPDSDMAIKVLRIAIDEGRRTFDVIKSVRAMFSTGHAAISEFSLNALIRETVRLLHRDLAVKKISLQLDLDELVPGMVGNRVQLQRVLVNLLTNAIESVGATGRGARWIRIRSANRDGHVLIEVSDSGVGIAPEKMAQIFDPFFSTKPAGTGLGLSLSRTIVEDHGGRLWASPGEGFGATLHLQLPLSLPRPIQP